MKQLSPQISDEVWVTTRYAIARFMSSKKAYKTNNDIVLTFKRIKEKNLPEQIQVHLRFNGTDTYDNSKDTLDVDFYIDESLFKDMFQRLMPSLP